jgi:pyruvate,orthophosphate dikinase
VRRDPSTEDVAGFAVASGILTAIGERTSRAAVVARQMGKVCIVGCRALTLAEGGAARLGDAVLKEGDWIALDGVSDEISLGRREIVVERSPELATVLEGKSGEN